MSTRLSKNYINNKTLYGAMIHYKNELNDAVRENRIKPRVPEYVGEAINLICSNLSKKGNFSGYSIQWKQEMISDGIMDCVAAVDNFNPDKSNNPFAYFTQIAWNAFLRRIQKEKKQTYIKHKNLENSFIMDDLVAEFGIQYKSTESSSEIVKAYEEKLTKTVKPVKLIGLERFAGDNDPEDRSPLNYSRIGMNNV